ncbi:DHA2 family efflux MFS transporter permease subunit [Actinocatenispora comari]|uniref:MFS transporter n=1 Tax=Actinocatenispora comari TaxID=2807577 RepID=A0A8J4EMJ5_9ACTN|nr:DHA2 family efflux MFS transporter permease subunit [Actinocatenispora comari]GIL28868.1 MFS transporter [Actinocatenispora comari]
MSRFKGNPWAVLFALCLGFFMILLDTTIVTIAVPAISDGLHASLDDILWIQSGYVLVYAVLLITAGRLGDMFGGKRIYLIGLVVFVLASAACGVARNPDQLIAARLVQGVGGALLTPQTLAIINRIFPPERRGAAFGVWGAVAGVAAIAGPTLGGLLITYASWEWIFYLNVPIGIVGFLLALFVVPNITEHRRHRLDILGTALITVALFLVTYGLIEGENYHWGRVWHFVSIPLIIALGVALVIVFLITQYFEKNEPLVPFTILRDRNYSLMNFVAMAMSFGMMGLFLPITIYLQSVLGLSAFDAGLTIAPMSLVSLVVAPFAGRLADKIGGKYILFVGLLLFAAGMALILDKSTVDSSRWTFLPGLLISGLGMGCIFAPMTTVAMRNIPAALSGAASGVFNTTRQLGAVVGSAAVGALLQAQLSSKLAASAQAHADKIPPQFREQFVAGFSRSSGGLDVGSQQSEFTPPPGMPQQAVEQLERIAADTFHVGYVDAMRPTLILPIAVLVLAALSCLLIKRRKRSRTATVPADSAAAAEPAE